MSQESSTEPPSVLRDRDVFQDDKGRVFVAHGFIQPIDRTVSYLKYIPDSTGKWISRGVRFKRVFSGGPQDASKGLLQVENDYVTMDPHFGTELLEVPKSHIVKYFHPETRMNEILNEGARDSLEEHAKRMAETLHDTLGIKLERIGVAGSISWHAHNPEFSDINMNVYGLDMTKRLQEGYDQMVEENSHIRIRKLDEWCATIDRLIKRVPALSKRDLLFLFSRRKEFVIEDRYLGVMPSLLPYEAPIIHGTESYISLTSEPIRVEMELNLTSYSSFTPALFDCESHPLDLLDGDRVSRFMVYDGAFKDLFKDGDRVEVHGTLQQVVPVSPDGTEKSFYQMMVGTKVGAGREFIRVIEPAAE